MRSDINSLVSPGDIVRLVNDSADSDRERISASAVSNWRKRSDDFPKPSGGTDSRPLFLLSEILGWLGDHDRPVKQNDLTSEAKLWFAASALRGQLDVTRLGPVVLLLACASKIAREERKEFAAAISELAERGLAGTYDELARIPAAQVEAIAAALAEVPDEDLAIVADATFERSGAAAGKYAGESGLIGSPISKMLADLAVRENEKQENLSVFDPACGIGETLMQIVDRRKSWGILIGQDINATTAMIARRRAFLRSTGSDGSGNYFLADANGSQTALARFYISNELMLAPTEYLYDALFNVVVAEPPFGLRVDDLTAGQMLADPRYGFGVPPKTSADTAWLQLAIAHLTDKGVGFVITAPGTLFRGGAEKEIRRELVRRGCVCAIVQLPGRLYKHTSIPLVLWVLGRPTEIPKPVLLIDASGEKTAAPTELVADWLYGLAPITVPHRHVIAAELAAGDVVLTPSLWTADDGVATGEVQLRFIETGSRARRLAGAIRSVVEEFPTHFGAVEPNILTIEGLRQQKVVEWALGSLKSRIATQDVSTSVGDRSYVVQARDIHAGWLPEPIGPFDQYQPSDVVTEAGDVLVATWNRISAIVDDVGGRVLGNGVYRLRVRNENVLLPEYLEAVLSGSWNKKFLGGATIQRANIKDLEVPLIPLAEQHRVAESLSWVRQARTATFDLERRLAEYEDVVRDAVRYGISLGGNDGIHQ